MAKGTLAVVFPSRGSLQPSAYEAITAGKALAGSMGESFDAVVVAGSKGSEFAKDLAARGPGRGHLIENRAFENFSDEACAAPLKRLIEKEGYARVVVVSTINGRLLAARLSAALNAGIAADVWGLSAEGGRVTAKRSLYGGNLIGDFAFASERQVILIQPLSFERAQPQASPGQVVPADSAPGPVRAQFVSFEPQPAGEIDLGSAERVVSGGRGLGNADGFKMIRELARVLGAAVGASRAVVDSGWIPYRHQVGLTGRTVRPKLYVACGISGQIQHLAGMSSAANIVAINTDPDCPMMKLASIAVPGDVNEIVPQLIAELKKRKGA